MALSGLDNTALGDLMRTPAANPPPDEAVDFDSANPLKTSHTVVAVFSLSLTGLFLCIRLYTRRYVTDTVILGDCRLRQRDPRKIFLILERCFFGCLGMVAERETSS